MQAVVTAASLKVKRIQKGILLPCPADSSECSLYEDDGEESGVETEEEREGNGEEDSGVEKEPE